jgi:hypothetical protein
MRKVLWPAAVLAVFVFTVLARADEKNDAKNQDNDKKAEKKKDTKKDENNNDDKKADKKKGTKKDEDNNNEMPKKGAKKKGTKKDEDNNNEMPRKGKKGGKKDQDNEQSGASNLPRMQFRHTTMFRRSGNFTLDGQKGTADYYFNGQRHKDSLAFVRAATVGGSRGHVYQVRRNGRKVGLWFFFSAKPSQDRARGEVYQMYYSLQPDDSRGRKMWTRILTPTGTKGTALGKGQDTGDNE